MRRNAHPPQRGEWTAAPGIGWQHGDIPPAPDGLKAPSRDVWGVWMRAWFAAHWTPEDLPGLHVVITLYDKVMEEGERQRANELRYQMEAYGITPKGQQDRRWTKPKTDIPPEAEKKAASGGRYTHLRSV